MEDAQPALKQDNFSRFAGHIHGTRYRDSHIGCVQRRSIVDPVPQVTDDVSTVFQSTKDPELLHRRHTRKDRGLLGDVPQSTITGSSRPTCLQRVRATSSLSPVRIFTCTPSRFRAAIEARVSGLGGSAKAKKPARVSACSSAAENAPFDSIRR